VPELEDPEVHELFVGRYRVLYLKRLRTRWKERRDRRGYTRLPDDEFAAWDSVAAWPDE
jgi:hypothetical protein